MNFPIGIAAIVAFIVIAELGRMLVAKLFGYPPERHAIPIMKLPGSRGTTGFRLMLILAGPVMVYLTVAGLAFAFFRCHGTVSPDGKASVEAAMAGFDAAGKLEQGDVVVEVDGAKFSGGSAELSAIVNAKAGAPVIVTIERDGAKQSFTVKPSKRDDKWLLGVRFSPLREYSTGGALEHGILYPARQAARTAQGLLEIVKGTEVVDAGGPTRIVSEYREAFVVTTTGERVLFNGMIFGTWTLIGLALFDLVRALLLILFRS